MTRSRKAILILAVLSAVVLSATLAFADHGGIIDSQAPTTSSAPAAH